MEVMTGLTWQGWGGYQAPSVGVSLRICDYSFSLVALTFPSRGMTSGLAFLLTFNPTFLLRSNSPFVYYYFYMDNSPSLPIQPILKGALYFLQPALLSLLYKYNSLRLISHIPFIHFLSP